MFFPVFEKTFKKYEYLRIISRNTRIKIFYKLTQDKDNRLLYNDKISF